MSIALKAENLSKAYYLGTIGTGTLSRDLERWIAKVRGKEDPFLKIGEVNDRTQKSDSDVVWSLKDINFEIGQGEAVGIIGRNGAGKSTLLKVLSRVTTPTTGKITGNGRIASLLEVGTGFHPELTGRENIYLNGAILGMRKKEIKSKFDEIVDFAGVQRFIDTPVKRYSSGMYVRLAFAVAAHLESEILIVDEVLAVGDAEFQNKCLGKMGEVSTRDGRTVLFVSHNMASIKSLCKTSILLKTGLVQFAGSTSDCIDTYLGDGPGIDTAMDLAATGNRQGNGKVRFQQFRIENSSGRPIKVILTGEDVVFVFRIEVYDPAVEKIDIGFSLHNTNDQLLSYLYSSFQSVYYKPSAEPIVEARFTINQFPYNVEKLIVKGKVFCDGLEADRPFGPLGTTLIEKGDFYNTGKTSQSVAPFLIKGTWQ